MSESRAQELSSDHDHLNSSRGDIQGITVGP